MYNNSKWRLPTRDELLVACENKIKGFGSLYYWSSDTVEGFSRFAWIVGFSIGNDGWDNKNDANYVRLVRDNETLEWSNNVQYMSWHEAQKYVKEINRDSNE